MAENMQGIELTDEELENANGGLLMFSAPQAGSSTGSGSRKKAGRTASDTVMKESVKRTATPGLVYSGEPRTSSRLGTVVTSSGPKILEDPGQTGFC